MGQQIKKSVKNINSNPCEAPVVSSFLKIDLVKLAARKEMYYFSYYQ